MAPMHGHALDLRSFEWLPQPRSGWELPSARLRMASDKIGEWLVVYGGHGESREAGEHVRLHKLNLRTLRWSTLDMLGHEMRFAAAPAATLTAGLVLGGVRFRMFGISPVAKLDVFLLSDRTAENDDDNVDAEQDIEEGDDEDSDDSDEYYELDDMELEGGEEESALSSSPVLSPSSEV
eukprot:gnl/TRDRNA2_/TRDRNA2_129748_c0_seq1.p1 gnl/TRDRNA2_/TRDRNA2_129748_c0~~gnl/TRDRNA2_/TRDRNA2_129748_c0_seq1.p1  ORF type:complete len:202 (-),score=30.52 gnl/TRDRNA2_/TRDRNA2_129748_c0_seq1:132-668(-)